jgi:hypothetical protein
LFLITALDSASHKVSSLTLQETEDANASEAIKLLTQFLTIILPAFMPSPSYSSASLRPNLVRWTSAINNRPTTLVLEQLVLLLAVFEECNSKSQNISLVPYKKEQVHEMVMAQSRSDLVLACESGIIRCIYLTLYIQPAAYGRFVAASPPTDPLTIVESWDRLRDTLLFILRGRYIEELEVPLAVLLSSNICWPLSKLLRNVDPSARSLFQYFLTSLAEAWLYYRLTFHSHIYSGIAMDHLSRGGTKRLAAFRGRFFANAS